MRGRAKMERKIGIKRMTFLLRVQTKYRVELEGYWRKQVVRKNVDAAAVEHGAGWATIRNDLARQNIALVPTAQQMLAKYEPLAFRAVMELCASRIAPPPEPQGRGVPKAAYQFRPKDPLQSTQAAVSELSCSVTELLAKNSEALAREGPKSLSQWLDAWKSFEQVDPKKRLAYRN